MELLRVYRRSLETNPSIYKKKIGNLISDFVKYYRGMGEYHELTIGYCVDLIIKEFIPIDYITSINDKDKHILLREIIINVVKGTINTICLSHINTIIDSRNEPELIDLLRDDIMSCLNQETNRVQKQFIVSEHYGTDEKYRVMYNDLIKNVKNKIEEKLKEITDLKNELNKYKNLYQTSINKIFSLSNNVNKLEKNTIDKDKKIETLLSDINIKDSKIRELQNNYSMRSIDVFTHNMSNTKLKPKIKQIKISENKSDDFDNNNITSTFDNLFSEKETNPYEEIDFSNLVSPDNTINDKINNENGGGLISDMINNSDNIF
jgi:hypothetical protein